MTSKISPDGLQAEQQALLAVLEQLLSPLARLCLAKGIPIQAAEEVMRRAYVQAATEDCEGLNSSRLTSRISTMTGLTRREVARLQSEDAPVRPQTRTVATDVLTFWASQSEYVNKKGMPIRLPRTGEAPSFEALAASVTKMYIPNRSWQTWFVWDLSHTTKKMTRWLLSMPSCTEIRLAPDGGLHRGQCRGPFTSQRGERSPGRQQAL